MKLENFSISENSIALESGNLYLDLHNNYDFKQIEYSIDSRKIRLLWIKNPGDWVKGNIPDRITLEFDGVSRLRIRERDPGIPYTEDECLSTIGFLPSDMWEYVDGYSTGKPATTDDLLMDFMSGMAMKISAESARCVSG